jgi:tRNA(fMet)-specific endonuclease VapC
MVADAGEVTAGGGGSGTRRILVDTSVVIAALRGEHVVSRRLVELPAASIFLPVIVLGELQFGARRSSRAEETLRTLEDFAASANTLPCDDATARVDGEVKNNLRRTGRPIPENDVWIAAVALQHGLVLVSRDAHFEYVVRLQLERW